MNIIKIIMEKRSDNKKIAAVITGADEDTDAAISRLCEKIAGRGAYWKPDVGLPAGYGTLSKKNGGVVFAGYIREEM